MDAFLGLTVAVAFVAALVAIYKVDLNAVPSRVPPPPPPRPKMPIDTIRYHIENETTIVLHRHGVRFNHLAQELIEHARWLGYQNIDYTVSLSDNGSGYVKYHFKTEQDIMLFKLTWSDKL